MTPLDRAPLNQEDSLPFTRPELVERRVWRNILVIIILAVGLSGLASDFRFTLGLALGGALAIFNYHWLSSSLRGVLGAGSEKTPPGTMLKFVVRWLVIAALGLFANQTGYFEGVGILAGLFTPAVAVIFEAAYVACRTLYSGTRNEY
jgi:ATP synthase I subunit